MPEQAEPAYAGIRLGRLLGVTSAGDNGDMLPREELFAGWRLFIERLAAENPVVLLVEDAQYADSGLLDFLDHLMDWVRQCGDTRSAARTQAILGQALRLWGRYGEAREQLTAAVAVLRKDPDVDTVRALGEIAALEVFAAAPAADALSAEALALGQDLAVDDATLAGLFTTRGIYHAHSGRMPEAASYCREAVRLATQAGDILSLGRALANLANMVTGTDPAAGAEAARAAAAQQRRAGARNHLTIAVENLAEALLILGDWDTVQAELTQATDADGLGDIELLACYRAWVAALRGDTATAEAMLAGLADLRASEDPQDKAIIAVAEAFTSAARRQPAAALRHARAALGHVGALGISSEYLRWAWPLAVRAAHDLADNATAGELLAMLDGYQPRQLAPMQRAERDLARARLAAADRDPDAADAAFAAAIVGLREHSTPYHLAHGLLDHAAHLAARGDTEAARAAISEAVGIAARLGCQPLGDRAERTRPARPAPRPRNEDTSQSELPAAGPATLTGGQILVRIPSLPRCGLFSGEPGGNPGRPA